MERWENVITRVSFYHFPCARWMKDWQSCQQNESFARQCSRGKKLMEEGKEAEESEKWEVSDRTLNWMGEKKKKKKLGGGGCNITLVTASTFYSRNVRRSESMATNLLLSRNSSWSRTWMGTGSDELQVSEWLFQLTGEQMRWKHTDKMSHRNKISWSFQSQLCKFCETVKRFWVWTDIQTLCSHDMNLITALDLNSFNITGILELKTAMSLRLNWLVWTRMSPATSQWSESSTNPNANMISDSFCDKEGEDMYLFAVVFQVQKGFEFRKDMEGECDFDECTNVLRAISAWVSTVWLIRNYVLQGWKGEIFKE